MSDKGWDEGARLSIRHVASPFINIEPRDKNIYIRPAVDGTMRALQSAKMQGLKE